jgi:hypothetical protein
MDRVTPLRRRKSVKAVLAIGFCAFVVCSPAAAKFRISIAATDQTPAVGQQVAFVLRTEQPLEHNLRLVAVAPGQPVFRVVATITGDTSRPDPNVARHGFEIRLTRLARTRWRGTARFTRTGLWRVVVPNWGPVGVVIPNGAAMLALSIH